MLPAGQLRDRVTIQQPVRVRTAMGGTEDTWQDVTTVWASVRQPSSNELFAAAQQQALVEHVVVIRYRTGIAANMRVMWRGRALDIVGEPADMDGTRRELRLRCVSGAKNGD